MKTVSVIGMGYIGLPTSLVLSKNFHVQGYDIDSNKIFKINQKQLPFVEPGLDDLLKDAIESKKLTASTQLMAADVYIICVPTPLTKEYPPKPDIAYVEDAVDKISPLLKDNDLVVLESTSPVGTTEMIDALIKQNRSDLERVYVAYCPERVLPGNIYHELINNDRIIGGVDQDSSEHARNFYKEVIRGEIFLTNDKTAELCKLSENAYRDINIAFANELSMIADENNIDIYDLIELTNKHPRVDILTPGVGVGGHCIAVDPWFIIDKTSRGKLIQTSRETNLEKTQWCFEKVSDYCRNKVDQKILCLGASYKPNIDDIRESPAIDMYNKLRKEFRNVKIYEPNTSVNTDKLGEVLEEINNSDVIICLVEHNEFKDQKVKQAIKQKQFFDFCSLMRQP
jgi:UDP-N-acetyl-D-mannosaminuronic acid dehydrogenase